MPLDHNEGFEKEALYTDALGTILAKHPTFKAGLLTEVIGRLSPDFKRGLFERRPCTRKLKYLGYHWCSDEVKAQLDDDDFVVGKVYESETFNGATYTLKGRERPIGCAYFERLT